MGEIYHSKLDIPTSLLILSREWAGLRSKDPRMKVGAAVYSHETGATFFGYNGFPRGYVDDAEIWEQRSANCPADKVCKSDVVIHAEANAVKKALQAHINPDSAILVCTHLPCTRCIRDAIALAGIRQVYFGAEPDDISAREKFIIHHIAFRCNITLTKLKG